MGVSGLDLSARTEEPQRTVTKLLEMRRLGDLKFLAGTLMPTQSPETQLHASGRGFLSVAVSSQGLLEMWPVK